MITKLLRSIRGLGKAPALLPHKVAKITYTMPCDYHGIHHVLDVYVPYWPDRHGGMLLVQDYLDDLVKDDTVDVITTEYDAVLPSREALFV